MAMAWALPESVQVSISRHHEPLGVAQPTSIHITALADAIAHVALDQPEIDAEALGTHPALVQLEIYPDAFQKLLTKAAGLRETAKVLS